MVEASGLRIGRILGVPVYLHGSWFIIFALITLSLATYFADLHPDWTEAQHWAAGIITSILFFGSVLFHELAHSVVAMRYRIPVMSITLFVFGGVARIGREPASARQEFYIAVAGPISSFLLAAGFYSLLLVFPEKAMVGALALWLSQINAALAVFNLVPGFPLDGGRILRSIVWSWTGDYARATRVAARGGQLFAYLLIFLGIWQGVTASLVAGLWLAFIGWFLLNAAQVSYAQVAMRMMLQGLRAGDVMSSELPEVGRSLSLEDYVHEMLRTGRRCHLVTSDGELAGLISLHSLNRFPREEWARTSVQAAMRARDDLHWTAPEESLLTLLERMQNQDINQMPVLVGDKVVGMISRDSILRVLQTRAELGDLAEW